MGEVMNFGDYIVYVDESGDPNLQTVFESYPLFVLAFCIFYKETYVQTVVPAFQRLKFKWFGHDCAVFHEREIRKQVPPFKFLQNEQRKLQFMSELTALMDELEFSVIAAVIDKRNFADRSEKQGNPSAIALQYCMGQLQAFLAGAAQHNVQTHCIFEKRGKKEDLELGLEFHRICEANKAQLDVLFVDKAANSIGLQISDLVARPIGLSHLRPGQSNRARDVILKKVLKDSSREPGN
jgi:Protein of unknown function (DUF3800)